MIGRPLSPTPHLPTWQRDERAAVEALTGEIRQALDAVVLQAETTDLLAGIAQVAAWTADDPGVGELIPGGASSGPASCCKPTGGCAIATRPGSSRSCRRRGTTPAGCSTWA